MLVDSLLCSCLFGCVWCVVCVLFVYFVVYGMLMYLDEFVVYDCIVMCFG